MVGCADDADAGAKYRDGPYQHERLVVGWNQHGAKMFAAGLLSGTDPPPP